MPDSVSFGFGLLMVKVSNELPPARIGLVPKDLAMLGASTAVRDAVADPPAPDRLIRDLLHEHQRRELDHPLPLALNQVDQHWNGDGAEAEEEERC